MEVKSGLVKRAKRGDAGAFQTLIHEEKEKKYRMAYVYMKNNEYFSTWLMKVLINTAIVALKGKQKVILINNEVFDQFGNGKSFQTEEQLDFI